MERSFSWDSMGSRWKVTVWDEVAPGTLEEIESEVVAASSAFDETYSRFKRTSLVWQLAEKTGLVEVPSDLVAMLRLYKELHEPSGRKLNPLVGHTISDLGYDDAYTLVPKDTIRATPDFGSLRVVDDAHVELGVPALIDLGAIGKGFFVDRIGAMLDARGIRRYLVDGSGDVLYRGDGKSITVGLEHPGDVTKVIGTLPVSDGAVCASGTNRRAWGDLHHVIDPDASAPTRGILATWAVAGTAALADGLASCLFFADPEKLRTQYPFEYCVLYDDYGAVTSPGLGATLA